MSEEQILYEALVLDALRGVVKTVLQRVHKRGMPGDHHFYISFETNAPGVSLSKRLKDQYPQEMTIVLQHQFWDLAVHDDRFEVRLSFNSIPERLVIPFAAIRVFSDPSVQFALGLKAPGMGAQAAVSEHNADIKRLPAPLQSDLPEGVPALPQPFEPVKAGNAAPSSGTGENDDETPRKSADVVSLDKFRKK